MHLRFIVIVSGALANVHLGPKEDLRAAADLVRSIPNSRHRKTGAACPLGAVVSTGRRNTLS
jgi:hypothetical protein